MTRLLKEVVLQNIASGSAAVRKLQPPAGDEQAVNTLLNAQQAVIDELKAMKTLKSLEELESHFSDVSKRLRKYGFTGCLYG